MSRIPVVSYLRHRQSGKGRACWTDALGLPRQKLLPGRYGSAESKRAFQRLKLEVESSPAAVADRDGITIVELAAAHHDHAEQHYRRADGTPTHEVVEYAILYKLLDALYGETPAAEFGPLALKAVRSAMLEKGWCRSLVNQRIGRVRRIFKWGSAEELIPFDVYHKLTTVEGLQAGRTAARETEPIGPVPDAVVDATLPFLGRHVAGLVELQRLTGCRPGEACLIRRADIDMSGPVWLYRPAHHKMAYRRKARIIAIGPKGQALLRRFFTPDLGDFLFSPRKAIEELLAERAANRKTPRWPSHQAANARKRMGRARSSPAEKYNAAAYGKAVARAANAAGVPHWHPNQLRHSFATEVRKTFTSLEHAGAALGHTKMSATEIYAERDVGLAVAVAAKIG